MNDKTSVSVKETTLDHLVPDDRNFNKGTEFGNAMIEKSLRKLGAGRSIVLDKNNRIIAGNKTIENAAVAGFDKVIIVETTGDQIVAVKRTDINLDSKKGRELALADNATSYANLAWDLDAIAEQSHEFDFNPDEWGIENPGSFIDDLQENSFSNLLNETADKFSVTFTFPKEKREKIESYIKENGKLLLESLIINHIQDA